MYILQPDCSVHFSEHSNIRVSWNPFWNQIGLSRINVPKDSQTYIQTILVQPSKFMHWSDLIDIINLLKVLGLGKGVLHAGQGKGVGDLDFSLEPQSSSHTS